MDKDREHTLRALDLAANGVGLVSPNPLVGCVIVSPEGDIAGEGFYTFDRVTHAEVIALAQAGEKARGGTAYVSLEPHDHQNKTRPCTEALIEAGIKRVICPIEDPNPLVRGRGFERLRNAGLEVVTGLLPDEASKLNEKFICWHQKGRPFVHLKLAMSLDGRISLNRSVSTGLSGDEARLRVQEFRHGHDAILVGGNTAAADDPMLTDRSGRPRRRPLTRVVLDNKLQIPATANVVRTANEFPTLVFTNSLEPKMETLRTSGVEVERTDEGARDLQRVLAHLQKREIQSVLVEGGSEVAGSFIDAGLVDKVTFLMSPLIIGGHQAPVAIGGTGASSLDETFRLRDVSVTKHGDDVEITGYPQAQ
ncbi:MAG TPA: bifunctional diaminohydroxyphosphoribosylaminopyrimidine deaminase/5-amino-6-(5-phosphoribosylamino)uracil reductase RibD [Pyrinomonadaceae bacterium]|nr:bifunctional diaminohydroxyphosphoribosylaminopyrimidine deaminase/5-amino-6-(5-phosphoribosylamino)uracil reductase RibD [Pyrinomonadaceae bacterium]